MRARQRNIIPRIIGIRSLQLPPKSAFPMKIRLRLPPTDADRFADCRQGAWQNAANPGRETIPGLTQEEVQNGQEVSNRAGVYLQHERGSARIATRWATRRRAKWNRSLGTVRFQLSGMGAPREIGPNGRPDAGGDRRPLWATTRAWRYVCGLDRPHCRR